MHKAISELRHEHDAILFGLDILDRMAAAARADRGFDPAEALGLVGFLKEFADTCHHGKEEGVLFPAMVEAGIPAEGGPVGVMLAEHETGRGLLGRMRGALEPSPDPAAFAAAAGEYSAFLRAHIEKENLILFPMGERAIPEERFEGIFEAFEAHEERVMGKGRHEELHAMLGVYERKYLGSP